MLMSSMCVSSLYVALIGMRVYNHVRTDLTESESCPRKLFND